MKKCTTAYSSLIESIMSTAKAARPAVGLTLRTPLLKGTRPPQSNSRRKSAQWLARLHARIAHLQADFPHKLTTLKTKRRLGTDCHGQNLYPRP